MIQNKYARRAAVIGVAVFGYPCLVILSVIYAAINAFAAGVVSIFEDAKDTHYYLVKEMPDVLRSGWRD